MRMLARTRCPIAALAFLGIALVAPGGRASAESTALVTSPPETRITFGPEGWTNARRPTFGYESNDPDAYFECRLDYGPFVFCGPATYESLEGDRGAELSEGPHTFEVRAVNADEVADPSPALASFSVDADPPTATILSGPSRLTHQQRPSFRLRVAGEDSFSCRIVGEHGRIKVRSCDGEERFRVPRPLAEGNYEMVLSAADRANSTEDRFEFSVRTKPGPPPLPPDPYRGSVLYAGRGKGISVRFRLRGRDLLEAHVVLTVTCTTELDGKRRLHRSRYVMEDASPQYPIRVDGRGGFKAHEPEPGVWGDWVERLVGRVTPHSIVGRAAVSFSEKVPESPNSETCHTGKRRPGSMRGLPFEARPRFSN